MTQERNTLINSGKWTPSRFQAFIISALRSAHNKWGPKHEVKNDARVKRGVFKCAGCGKEGPATLPPLPGNKRRRNNAAVDHIEPVIDPATGFVSWDEYIKRMFLEAEGYQVLCWECHKKKTDEENLCRKQHKKEQND